MHSDNLAGMTTVVSPETSATTTAAAPTLAFSMISTGPDNLKCADMGELPLRTVGFMLLANYPSPTKSASRGREGHTFLNNACLLNPTSPAPWSIKYQKWSELLGGSHLSPKTPKLQWWAGKLKHVPRENERDGGSQGHRIQRVRAVDHFLRYHWLHATIPCHSLFWVFSCNFH